MPADPAQVAEAWQQLVIALGYDPKDPHLVDSPKRVARFLNDWHTEGKEPPTLTVFPSDGMDELVLVGDLQYHAVCAHHGVPFFGRAHIAYIPDGKLVGLSKFARVLDHFAHRFTTQERITQLVASYLEDQLAPKGVGVVLKGEHLCMSMRGVQKHGHATTTSVMRGVFRADRAARSELLSLVRK